MNIVKITGLLFLLWLAIIASMLVLEIFFLCLLPVDRWEVMEILVLSVLYPVPVFLLTGLFSLLVYAKRGCQCNLYEIVLRSSFFLSLTLSVWICVYQRDIPYMICDAVIPFLSIVIMVLLFRNAFKQLL